MKIKCWGTRGGIPVSGNMYNKYGGDSTCFEVRTDENDVIIVDAGTGIRRLGSSLPDEGLYHYHLLLTHVHWDHIMGFPFFKPIYMPQSHIEIYGCPYIKVPVKKIVANSMESPYFPVEFNALACNFTFHDTCGDSFMIGKTEVNTISISHPNQGVGYKFMNNGHTFVFLTDNELSFSHEGGLNIRKYVEFCSGADILMHDAEFTVEEYKMTKMWGHSVYEDVLDLGIKAGVKKLGLIHHNQSRSDEELDRIVIKCRKYIQDKGSSMECFAVAQDMVVEL